MNGSELGTLARAFASLSLVAIGGASATLPEVRALVVEQRHWLTGDAFTQAFATAQAAPGPNVLLASLIGWKVAGLAGLLIATLAMNGPSSFLAFAVSKGWGRWSGSALIQRLERTLAPLAAALICAGGAVLIRSTGRTPEALALTGGVGALILCTRRNPLWASAAAIAVAARHLGIGT